MAWVVGVVAVDTVVIGPVHVDAVNLVLRVYKPTGITGAWNGIVRSGVK
jgi:hypothetical protein